MEDSIKYWAFISYSHRDLGWANWLHRALERYRVPSRLVGQASRDGAVPKRLYPIFRDRDELPSSPDLDSEIHRALRASRYLIVICSPRSAASKWVNEEVRYFKSLGREDRVVCLIVDGEPNASVDSLRVAEECFPPALRFRIAPDGTLSDHPAQPVAADVRKSADGRSGARLKLIAGLIHVGLDELRQREMRRRIWLLAAAASLSLLFAISTSILAVSAYRARNEARLQTERVQRTKSFFVSIFENANPLRRQDTAPQTVVQALDDALHRIDTELAGDPRLQGDLLDDFGEIKAGLGDLAKAREMFRRALPLHEQTLLPNDPAIANTLVNLGAIEGYMGQTLNGRPYMERAVAILEQHADTEGDALSNARNGLGSIYKVSGDNAAAIEQFLGSLAYYRKSPGPKERRLGVTLGNLGTAELGRGNIAAARTYFLECLNVIQRNLGPQSANLLDCLYGLAEVSDADKASAEQLAYAQRDAEIARASFSGDHPWLARALIALGRAELRQSRPLQGEALLREGAGMLTRLDANMDIFITAQTDLAASRLQQGSANEAMTEALAGLAACAKLPTIPRPPGCGRAAAIRDQASAALGQRASPPDEKDPVVSPPPE